MSHIRPKPTAEAIMTGSQVDRRKTKREFVQLPARIQVQSLDASWHVGLVRDLTRDGIFFYSDFRPSLGDSIKVMLKFTGMKNSIPNWYRGNVMRVEEGKAGASFGIALSLERYDFIDHRD
jgi:hypothetical protein